jgi:holo-[acyl-carrier protein] synthase
LINLFRFAAKEACRKACDHLDNNTRGFHHIIILPLIGARQKEHQSQRPEGLVLHEALQEVEKTEPAEEAPFDVSTLDGQICEISISHDGEYASAVALVPSMKHADPMSPNDRKDGH